jgi:hypothetical protein
MDDDDDDETLHNSKKAQLLSSSTHHQYITYPPKYEEIFCNSSPEQLILLTVSSCAQLNTFCKIWGPYSGVVTD